MLSASEATGRIDLAIVILSGLVVLDIAWKLFRERVRAVVRAQVERAAWRRR